MAERAAKLDHGSAFFLTRDIDAGGLGVRERLCPASGKLRRASGPHLLVALVAPGSPNIAS
jgi:hypothetical protein